MGLKNTVEYLYLALMLRWEEGAPPDGHQGLLDGELARNTQITRMARVLRLVAPGGRKAKEDFYQRLAGFTRRDDGQSYVSKDRAWMNDPCSLDENWFFEGCTSLVQKQAILDHLTKFGLSNTFVACASDFVAGKSIRRYLPTDQEAEEILRRSIDDEQRRGEQ